FQYDRICMLLQLVYTNLGFYVLFSLKKVPKKSSLRIFDILDSAKRGFLPTSNIRMRPLKLRMAIAIVSNNQRYERTVLCSLNYGFFFNSELPASGIDIFPAATSYIGYDLLAT